MIREDLGDPCVCGHERRWHHGFDDGPCLVAHTSAVTGKQLDGTVCACSTFRAVEAPRAVQNGPASQDVARRTETVALPSAPPAPAKPAPKRRPPRRAREPEHVGGDCWLKSCNDPATVILERDGRPYCRPHGLAASLKLPRCEIRELPRVLSGQGAS